jgi:hypothetical protein
MNIGSDMSSSDHSVRGRVNLRVWMVVGALVLVAGALFLLQRPAEAQINFNQFIVAILLAIRNAFAGSPFFGFIVAIIDQLIEAFGGAISG